MQAIKPEIQEAILDLLPADAPQTVELMCQLLANIMVSINGTGSDSTITLPFVIERLKTYLAHYEGI